MKKAAAITIIGLALLGSAWVAAQAWKARSPASSPTPQPVRILFTGEIMGELEPCNCGGVKAGGLPAVGAYAASVPQPRLVLDTGNVALGARDFEQLRLDAALRGMREIGYDAINVGQRELWLGRADLQRYVQEGAPFVSANVAVSNGAPAAPDHIAFNRAGRNIIVTGVVDDGQPIVGEGLTVQPPDEALARLVPTWAAQSDFIVVLADLPIDKVRHLAELLPEIDLILFSGRGDAVPLQQVHRTHIASVQGEARYVGDISAGAQMEGLAVTLLAEMGESAPVRRASIDWYKQRTQRQMFDIRQPRPGSELVRPRIAEAGNGFVGSDACRRCHPAIYEQWSTTSHSRGMASLKTAGYDWSPECIICHTVGYGAPDGYQSMAATPALGNIGCESCHGPGRILLDGNCRGKARLGNAETCLQCHSPKRDPHFNFAAAWPKVAHPAPSGGGQR